MPVQSVRASRQLGSTFGRIWKGLMSICLVDVGRLIVGLDLAGVVTVFYVLPIVFGGFSVGLD